MVGIRGGRDGGKEGVQAPVFVQHVNGGKRREGWWKGRRPGTVFVRARTLVKDNFNWDSGVRTPKHSNRRKLLDDERAAFKCRDLGP